MHRFQLVTPVLNTQGLEYCRKVEGTVESCVVVYLLDVFYFLDLTQCQEIVHQDYVGLQLLKTENDSSTVLKSCHY